MRQPHRTRALLLIAAITIPAILVACQEEPEGRPEEGQDARASVTETDVIQCGMTGTLLDNRTAGPYNVHVRVKNECTAQLADTLLPPADEAHLKVLDQQNRVVNGQDIAIASQATYRGVVTVTANSRLVLECGRRAEFTLNRGCTWSYTYSP